jgi:cell wall-active antibiotic response 4TMS protein YvqF
MTTVHSSPGNSGAGATAVAFTLILAGVLLLLDNFGIVFVDRVWDLWPLTLIAAGLAELLHWSRQRET